MLYTCVSARSGQVNVAVAPPLAVMVGTMPGGLMAAATSGAQSAASAAPSLSSSGSRQLYVPSRSVSASLSTMPSQLSSAALHTSGLGSNGTQVLAEPPVHWSTVRAQAPTPQLTVPSSAKPSQSSSRLLQV